MLCSTREHLAGTECSCGGFSPGLRVKIHMLDTHWCLLEADWGGKSIQGQVLLSLTGNLYFQIL